ncbi:MAG: alkaline phosphatase [Lysobacteraceae bacterium]|nr:MAG: alkaline phosphatase [Xanthomonadaceae bacterium]
MALETTSSREPLITLQAIGSYQTGRFDEAAQEISAYDPLTYRLYVTNADANTLDIVSIRNPRFPSLLQSIDLSVYGGGPNSVAVSRGNVAVAVEADNKTDNGSVVFFNRFGEFRNQLTVGALPDMLAFSPDGQWLVVANEGEPNDDYTIDPEGSISVIDLSAGIAMLTDSDVRTADFHAFNDATLDSTVRIYGPNATVAQDLEPEYIAVSADSTKAWVSLQENNAMAVVDLVNATVTNVIGLGFKDHSSISNALDASNRDDAINIRPWPVYGMYQPDTLASYTAYDGRDYVISANEGDARDYDGYSEEARVKDLTLDPIVFPDAADLQQDENLGRLKTTVANGDIDGDGDVDEIMAYGARSFSIWNDQGVLIYDSGADFERMTASVLPNDFNSTNDENGSFDNRSDDKGPEPEGVAIGEYRGRTFAFIGLERVGGIMVYDVTNPVSPRFVEYVNTRDFTGDAEAGTAGDLGAEGLLFVPAWRSPIGYPLLVVTNEVSGSTTIFKIRRRIL